MEEYNPHANPQKYINENEVTIAEEGQAIDLGTLEVTASLEGVYQRLYDRTLLILATQAVKTFLVSFFILSSVSLVPSQWALTNPPLFSILSLNSSQLFTEYEF